MHLAANIQILELPGICLDASPTNLDPIRQMRLQEWRDERWERLGDVIEGANV